MCLVDTIKPLGQEALKLMENVVLENALKFKNLCEDK